ncbi:MAG: sugar ABC transporter permease [Acidimicrobiales bacterium]
MSTVAEPAAPRPAAGAPAPVLDHAGNVTVETRARRRLTGLTMVAPMLIVVLVFMGWPAIWTFVLSFTNMTVTGPTATHYQFVGLANYRELFSYGSGLLDSVGKSLYYLIVSGYIGQAALGFLLAYFLSRSAYGVRAVVGAVVIVAWLIPEIVTSYMWYVLLSDGGVMQQGYHLFGLNYQTWLISNPMLAVSLANAWRGAAFSFLLFSAALDGIPNDLIDASEVDGASSWRRLTRLTIPLVSSAIVVDLVIITLGTLNDFSLIYAMTGGGPGNASNVLSVFMYRQAFSNYQLAYGTAIAVVLLLMGAVLAAIYIRLLRRQGSLADMR